MATKIICIDEQHAINVDAMTQFKSVRLGRAVVMDIEPTDEQVPQIMTYAIGYTDEPTSYDLEQLHGKSSETV